MQAVMRMIFLLEGSTCRDGMRSSLDGVAATGVVGGSPGAAMRAATADSIANGAAHRWLQPQAARNARIEEDTRMESAPTVGCKPWLGTSPESLLKVFDADALPCL